MGQTRGRKRKAGKREPNGKPSRRRSDKQQRRSLDEQANMQVAKEARQRLFGLTDAESATDLPGSVVGRLLLAKRITESQYDAAQAFQATYASYQRLVDSPRSPKAVEIGAATGMPISRDYTRAQADGIKERWTNACLCLARANAEHRHTALYAACQYIVLRDSDQMDHLVDDLRLALDALAAHFGLLAKAA